MSSETLSSSKEKDLISARTGYFDHVFAVFKARQHPIVLVEEAAMRWMGLRVINDEDLDLLIKDAQLEDMIADLLATGQYKRVEQNLNYRWDDAYVKQVPRLRYTGEHAVLYSCLSLWSETVYMLSADAPMVEVPDVCAWNPVLVEDRLDPAAADVISISYKTRMAAGDQILPRALAQSLDTHVPVYVPSIPQFTDALLDQQRYRLSHAENYRSSMGTLPSYHLSNFVRYLHLEKKYQREKILPGLADRNKADMEKRLNKFKRKPLLKAPVPQVLR